MAEEVPYHHAANTGDHRETAADEKSDRGLFDFSGKKDENSKSEDTQIEFECKDEKKGDKNENLLQKLHLSDSSSSSSSDEECEDGEKKNKNKKKKKKDKSLKHKVVDETEEDKMKINVKIEEGKEKIEEIKEKIEEKIEEYKEKKEEKKIEEHKGGEACVPVEKYEEVVVVPPSSDHHAPPPQPPCEVVVHPPEPSCEPEEKKGFLEKIKDKLPGGHKKVDQDDTVVPPPPPPAVAVAGHGDHDGGGESEHKEKKGIFEKIKEKLPGYHSKSDEEKKEKECD